MKRKNMTVIRGVKPLSYFSNGDWLGFSKWKLYRFDSKTAKRTFLCKIPVTSKRRICSVNRILQRRFSLDKIQAVLITDESALVYEHHRLYLLTLAEEGARLSPIVCDIPRLTVLHFCKNGKNVYFGDYGYDLKKSAKSIYAYSLEENCVKCMYTFADGDINHVHNICYDRCHNRYLILTGDFENSAAIYEATEDFSDVRCICSGSQEYRSCQCIANADGVYYFTDSPFQENYLMRLSGEGNSFAVERLHPIYGSCIYAMSADSNIMIASTTVENQTDLANNRRNFYKYNLGEGIKGWYVELIRYRANDNSYAVLARFKKDILPMLPFGYGALQFPYNYESHFPILFYGYAVKRIDGCTVIATEG